MIFPRACTRIYTHCQYTMDIADPQVVQSDVYPPPRDTDNGKNPDLKPPKKVAKPNETGATPFTTSMLMKVLDVLLPCIKNMKVSLFSTGLLLM